MQSIPVNDFNLKHTLESGQFFRFKEVANAFLITAQEKIFSTKQQGNELFWIGNASKSFVKSFFNLEQDFSAVKQVLAKEKHIFPTIQQYKGLRILNQDPWECLIAFLCSSFSNIKKIQGNLELLSKTFGAPIRWHDLSSYSFPRTGKINDLEKIRACGVGYRAEYIYETNKQVSNKFLNSLKSMTYLDAKNSLTELPGVGEKVADCVLLFSLGFGEAFPVDVWIERAMRELYFDNQKVPIKTIREFAQQRFGSNAGYAQQYLYHWRRLQG